MITLHQFPFSHFCEKARWALEHKGVPYKCRNLLPGLHRRVTGKIAPRTCVPVLVDGVTVVQDSTAILTFLDERYPEHPLTPRDPRGAREAIEWEQFLDEEVGVPLRLWFYFHTLPDRERALRFLLDRAPWYGPPLFALIFPRVRAVMQQFMGIDAASARQAEDRLQAAFDRLDAALADRRRFLVGDRFSRADLTACALLAPFCAPGKSEAELAAALPAAVRAWRDLHRARPFFVWAAQTYASHRLDAAASPAPARWSDGATVARP
jgi:glutathione S-transferase